MNQNLTQGPIVPSLVRLALPIIGMSFVQMAYNMVDMIWLGRVGANAVAAVGTATFFTWFGISLLMAMKSGVEITVSQEVGRGDKDKASRYAGNAVLMAVILAVVFGVFTFLFSEQLIGFFDLKEMDVNDMAISYLKIIALGAPFYYTTPTLGGVFTGAGNSHLPFRMTSAGLLLNIIIDPLFIFGWGPLPALGSNGAALATILAQLFVFGLFSWKILKGESIIQLTKESFRLTKVIAQKIIRLGVPVAANSALFISFSIMIAKIVSSWGALPIAVQSVGAQIEAISWMTASGFSTALGAYTGQNFGANKWYRIYKGFLVTVSISVLVGLMATLAFLGFGEEIFSMFIPEADAIHLGGIYLGILAVSQVFMCMEISTSGAFYGIGKTVPPSLVSIVLTGSRIPLALLLSGGVMGFEGIGLEGVWWSVSLTSIVKGLLLFGWFYWLIYNRPERMEERNAYLAEAT
ncbi:MATE family efflux transporter [Sansalvadorimonas verongulae]|uniref:MATE family efflux transporter n=1 Tax=Sansalvadorimonas verongulae TaxID=2172824 RepID=UPI0012BC805F|nr:MATE family efflux transporter [Sansalvadorimonas verongulae]MTI15423.1 MATE family efflux transporter [Sansalvadorimonas verongulae]